MARGGDALLRRFVACREAGDADGMVEVWNELVEAEFDRVRASVAIRGSRRLSADERDEALQRALVRIWQNMVATFRGTSMGEWVNAMVRAVDFAVLDVQRDAARRSNRETVLGDDVDRAHPGVAQEAVELHERLGEQEEAAERLAQVDAALARLPERRRRILELDRAGVPAAEIAAELGLSMDNLYQLRSRGLRELRTILGGW